MESTETLQEGRLRSTVGSGEFRYQIVDDWGRLPSGWSLSDVAAVAVDSKDRVYVFNRGEHPMIVFDSEGNFLTSWGEGIFHRPHGLHMGPDDTIYCTDDGDHTVRRCTLDGKVILEIGVPGMPAPYMSGNPFHRCTHTALSPNQDIFVTDGYGNSRIHKYSPAGKLLQSWGEPGTGPGQFNIAHNICSDRDGWLYVADRENHRIQVFDQQGRYETQWSNLHRPCGLVLDHIRGPLCYIGELGPSLAINRAMPNIGPRITINTTKGDTIVRLGDVTIPGGQSSFIAPHGVAVDSTGNIYVGEVSYTHYKSLGLPIDQPLCVLRKLMRLA